MLQQCNSRVLTPKAGGAEEDVGEPNLRGRSLGAAAQSLGDKLQERLDSFVS